KRWKQDLEKTYRVPPEDFIAEFLKKTNFKPAITRWTPGLLDEVRGIADAAGIDFDTMYVYQLIDEQWAIGPDVMPVKCTTIAAGKKGGSPAYVAQTLDLPEFYDGYQTVLRIKDDKAGLETLVFTIPGVIAANGLNSRSVGVCVNAVTQLAYSTKGLPVDFVVRGLLRQQTFEQAVDFLGRIEPAAPQTYVIGGPNETAVFERSVRKMARFIPFEGAEFSYHTNQPMVNDDYNPRFPEMLKAKDLTLEAYRAQDQRLAQLGRVLKDNAAAIDRDSLEAIFKDRISGINNKQTYGCTIMVLGEEPELHIVPGRPDLATFQVLKFPPRPKK
ncbi:MAG TPA: C45 family peptidase, partial [Acidobacteriota bacterium]|nr:C45 family peptidase [Acidobacteriota bacterium]